MSTTGLIELLSQCQLFFLCWSSRAASKNFSAFIGCAVVSSHAAPTIFKLVVVVETRSVTRLRSTDSRYTSKATVKERRACPFAPVHHVDRRADERVHDSRRNDTHQSEVLPVRFQAGVYTTIGHSMRRRLEGEGDLSRKYRGTFTQHHASQPRLTAELCDAPRLSLVPFARNSSAISRQGRPVSWTPHTPAVETAKETGRARGVRGHIFFVQFVVFSGIPTRCFPLQACSRSQHDTVGEKGARGGG